MVSPASFGDIFWVSLAPTFGHEIQKRRPVVVVSPTRFNRANLPLVAPITHGAQAARAGGMAVALDGLGLKTNGVVNCSQLRSLDLEAPERNAEFIEQAPIDTMRTIVERIADIFEF